MTTKPSYEELERRVQELQESEIYYRTLFENVNDAVLVYEIGLNGKPGKFIDVNSVALKRLGYTHDELLNLTPRDITTENGYKELSKARANVISNSAAIFETTHYSRNGRPIPVESHVSVVELAGQKVAVSVVRDLSERKRAEEALMASEKRLTNILSGMTDLVWSISWPDLTHNYLSPSLEKIYGRSEKEFMDNPTLFKEVTHPDDQYLTENAMKQLVEEGKAERECRIIKPDGTIVWVNDRSKMIYDENHQPIRVEGVTRDITEYKEAEKALREKTNFLHNIIDTTSDLVSVTDMEGNFTFIGPSHSILGYDPDSLVGRNVMELVHPDDYQAIATAFADFLANREDGRMVEYRYRRADGDYLWLETVGKFIFDDAGNLKEILFTSRDFTARKRAEGELKRIEWMLSRKPVSNIEAQTETHDQGYGDLTELNRDGIILKSIGHERLISFAHDYLDLLGTSSAIYEVNGDYAFGIFASGWCQMMDRASRTLCNTPDNVEALNSGRWLCHESCWTDCSKEAIAKRAPVDIECKGGIRLYAVPIFAGGNVIGAINFGYGDPPKDPEKLKMLADAYHLNHDDLLREATAYDSRPPYIIEMAKKRLNSTATLIGSMVETNQATEALRASEEKHRRLFETMAQGVVYHSADGVIISANPAAERILGLSFEQMQGKTSNDPRWKMILEDGTEVPGTDHPAMLALRTGETVGPVIRGVFHPDKNAYVWLSITAIPLFQPGETKPFQTYATFEDVTEHRQAVEALREREAFIKATLDNLPVGVAVNSVDPKVNFTYMNDNFAKFYRTTREALAEPNDFWEVVYPDATFREELKKRVLADCADNDPERMHWKDVPVSRPGKKIFYITARNIPLPERNQMVSTVWDVTERKRTEERLREQLDFSESLIETAQAIILLLDTQGRIVRFNSYMEDLVGYDLDEVKGKDWFDTFIEPENGNAVKSVFQKAIDDIQTRGNVNPIIARDGRTILVEWFDKTLIDRDGRTVGILAIGYDITERKRAEEAVRLNEEKLKSIFRVAPTGIGVVINRTFTEVNPKVCEMTGYRSEELLGKSAGILYPTKEEHEFVGKEKYRQIAKHGTGSVETRWQRKDGKIIDVLLSSTPVDSDDLSKGATFTALDITEIKRFREELKQLNAELEMKVKHRTAMLEASNKELEAFSYSVSHDLRAPLRHISGYIDLLNKRFREGLPEKAGHYLNEVKDSAHQMGTLIDDLLQFSRTGRQDVQRVDMDMNAAVQEALEKLKVDTQNRNISWTVADLPRVFGDYSLLKQVWMNLLENAVKYTHHKDEAEIEVGFTRDADQWEFFVHDNGAGFDMQYVHKLFGVFQRLHSSTEFEGTGIGLANVQRIIHKHGGRVRAEGKPEKGATFYFTIPEKPLDEGSKS